MTQQQETVMNDSNDNRARPDVQDDIINLGVASEETKGLFVGTEIIGNGAPMTAGISEE